MVTHWNFATRMRLMHSAVNLLICEKEPAKNDARWMQNQIRRESYIVKGECLASGKP